VEAYWIGNRLLDRVALTAFGDSLRDRFRSRFNGDWLGFSDVVRPGAVPHHSFHVLSVYPWLGMLRAGRQDPALAVIDRCRIRWGRVLVGGADGVVVESRPLVVEARALSLGAPTQEIVRAHPGETLQPGDMVALHWDWVCERLDERQRRALIRQTRMQLSLANHFLSRVELEAAHA